MHDTCGSKQRTSISLLVGFICARLLQFHLHRRRRPTTIHAPTTRANAHAEIPRARTSKPFLAWMHHRQFLHVLICVLESHVPCDCISVSDNKSGSSSNSSSINNVTIISSIGSISNHQSPTSPATCNTYSHQSLVTSD